MAGSTDILVKEIAATLEADILNTRESAKLNAARAEYIRADILIQTLDQLGVGRATLQAARAAQRLLLNAAPVEQGASIGVAGSCAHALGVRPEDLDCSDRKQDSLKVRASLPAVEAHLAAWASSLATALRGPSTTATAPPFPASASGRDQQSGGAGDAWTRRPSGTSAAAGAAAGATALPQLVAQQKAAVASRQAAVQRELVALLGVATRLLALYGSMDRDMLAFADQEVVKHQAGLDQKNLSFDVAWVDVMAAKLGAIEAQMEAQTYAAGHVQALGRVHALIQEQMASTQAALEQVTLKLENYHALGDSFRVLAREYGAVRQQLAEAKGMLAKFDDLKSELADTWHE